MHTERPTLCNRMLASCLLITLPMASVTAAIRIPAGTTVFAELDEQVTSKKKDTSVGDIVRARVWRDVTINGRVVIKAGTPVMTRVSKVTPAKMAGRRGDLEIDALSTHSVDGNEVLLDGGYDKSGKGNRALTWTLFALVAWPLIFIKGKQAVLDPGIVFDGIVQSETDVAIEPSGAFALKLGGGGGSTALEATVLYDEMNPDDKQAVLPLMLRSCANGAFSPASVIAVNDKPISPLAIKLGETGTVDACQQSHATINLKDLAEHFIKGINRFTIDTAGTKTEVILEIEV